MIEAADRVVAIESKLTEYLGGNERATFADRYREVVGEIAHPTWGEVFTLLEATPDHFRFLKADQLVKHYLGLKRAQQNDPRPVTLSYLHWEPVNPEADMAFAHHRSEAAEFAGRIADPEIAFWGLSYPEALGYVGRLGRVVGWRTRGSPPRAVRRTGRRLIGRRSLHNARRAEAAGRHPNARALATQPDPHEAMRAQGLR